MTHRLTTFQGKPDPVAILGGGLAGLIAARILHRAGIPFHLFEARDRLGGRILTVGETGLHQPDGFDLGPSWFWPQMQPQLAELISDLGLQAMAQHDIGDMMFDQGTNRPPQRIAQFTGVQGSMRMVGGTDAVIRALAKEIPADSILLNAEVTHLTLGPDTVRLDISGVERPVLARHVISTLPPRLMAQNVHLNPNPPSLVLDRWRETPTWMAPHAKFVAVYNAAFWREDGLSGMAQSRIGPLVEIHDATTASGKAALFGFIGLPAKMRSTLPQEELARAAVAQMERLFGPKAASPRATLLKDWATDRLTNTDADTQAPGHPQIRTAAWVTGDWADHLTLAGSETSITEPGYLAGAVEAATRATQTWLATASR